MKKIVALVLSLVMVLGLATTAFAATTSTGSVATTSVTPVKAALYTLATAGGSMELNDDTIAKIDVTTVTGKVDADVAKYVPTIYNIDGSWFVEVAKANANFALKNNGAYVYLYHAFGTSFADVNAVVAEYATAVVMDSIVLPADDEIDCGDCYKLADGKVAAYYVSGDDFYYVGGADFAYMNGQFVSYDATTPVVFDSHNWDADSIIVKDTDVKGVKVPVSIACENCEKTFKVVNALAFENTWVKGVNYDESTSLPAGYYIVLDAATEAVPSAPAAGETVESAKTFDAGIAMYVGMSVMAAAGSAVVLKKKD